MIWFNVFEARQQLISKGYVYTIRNTGKKDKELAICNSGGHRMHIGVVEVEFVCFVMSKDDLEFFVKDSGFKTKEKWYELALKLHGDKKPLRLYKATLVDRGE